MSASQNATGLSALELTNRFTIPAIGQPKLDIPPTEITERGMQLITARDINHILDASDVAPSSTSWRSFGRDGAIRHHLNNVENHTCGVTNTEMKVGHGSSTQRGTGSMNTKSDMQLTGKNIVHQPFSVSTQYNIQRSNNTSSTLPAELGHYHTGTENGKKNTSASVSLVHGKP